MPENAESYSLSQTAVVCKQRSKILANFVFQVPTFCWDTCANARLNLILWKLILQLINNAITLMTFWQHQYVNSNNIKVSAHNKLTIVFAIDECHVCFTRRGATVSCSQCSSIKGMISCQTASIQIMVAVVTIWLTLSLPDHSGWKIYDQDQVRQMQVKVQEW